MAQKYLLPPEEYPNPNPRIDGFRKLKEVGARTVDILVFSPKAFREFEQTGKLSPAFVQELHEQGESIIQGAETRAAVVRRAYVVPGLENPPGPRFIGLKTVREVVEAVKGIFSFATEQGFHEHPQSQISGFLYPFVDPPMLERGNLEGAFLPYGGNAVLTNDSTVEIYAVFGNIDGIRYLVADRYVVEVRRRRYFIEKKDVPQKTQMECTTTDSEADILNVPAGQQFEQILSDNEVLEIARVVFELSEKYSSQRVEFSADEQGLVFNEVADYWREVASSDNSSYQLEGEIMVVNSLADLRKLKEVNEDDLASGRMIVLVGQDIIANRSNDVLGALASWQTPLVVLYPGVAATQHAMRVLVDKGHRALLVGTQKFDEGDLVEISTTGTKARVTNHTRLGDQKIVSLWDAAFLGPDLCGIKAYRLSQMKLAGFNVPHGQVITTRVFAEFLEFIGHSMPIDLEEFAAMYAAFERIIGDPEHPLHLEIELLLSDYVASGKRYIPRSSSPIEDGELAMAGIFESVPDVEGHALVTAGLQVMQSTYAPKVAAYLQGAPELLKQLQMAVPVQEMVDTGETGSIGVIFGADTQTRNFDTVIVEAGRKSGEVVDDTAKEIERYMFSRSEKKVIDRRGPTILSPQQARALFLLSERLRALFNDVPQDIEWGIDQYGLIWVLQSRDLKV